MFKKVKALFQIYTLCLKWMCERARRTFDKEAFKAFGADILDDLKSIAHSLFFLLLAVVGAVLLPFLAPLIVVLWPFKDVWKHRKNPVAGLQELREKEQEVSKFMLRSLNDSIFRLEGRIKELEDQGESNLTCRDADDLKKYRGLLQRDLVARERFLELIN